MKTVWLLLLSLALGVGFSASLRAQTAPAAQRFTLSAYLAAVARGNLDYAAARYSVSIAQAQLAAARLFPNPTLQLGRQQDVTHRGWQKEPTANSIGLDETIGLGGKRGDRIAVADRADCAAAATLDDFFRNLRATATDAYIDAVVDRMIVGRMRQSADALDRLVAANQIRKKDGDIGEVDLIQSRVDALQYRSSLLAAESDARTAQLALSQLLGPDGNGIRVEPDALLAVPARTADPETLARLALGKRPDIAAARASLAAAQAGVRLARANRLPDVDVGLTFTHNLESHNDIAPAPRYNTVGVAVSLPLPLFNTGGRDLEIARYSELQAEKSLGSVELQAEVQVRQAWEQCRLATQSVAGFSGGGLQDTDRVFAAKLYSYAHGDGTLLDVLAAQQAVNDVNLAYCAALSAQAKAYVALLTAAGTWDPNW